MPFTAINKSSCFQPMFAISLIKADIDSGYCKWLWGDYNVDFNVFIVENNIVMLQYAKAIHKNQKFGVFKCMT